jgi:hypothetical protein
MQADEGGQVGAKKINVDNGPMRNKIIKNFNDKNENCLCDIKKLRIFIKHQYH